MKSLINGFVADVFPTKELKEMQAEITRVLKEREKEREKIMGQYQEELDRLLEAIKGDGFHMEWDDYYNIPFVEEDDEDEDDD